MGSNEGITSLETALDVIRSLESRLEELNDISRKYEMEMESMVDNLTQELQETIASNSTLSQKVVDMEIRVDDLENDKNFLSNKNEILKLENDKLLESNILLNHEIHDLKQKFDHLQSTENQHLIPKRKCKPIKVSTNANTLSLQSMSQNSTVADLKLSKSTVISTTMPKG
ncbi:hypothetical protein KAFR_0I02040 [Kazachstania africana CBS 2517]|uniref:Uncharacterized protein n=1 Tax=Kazachstania africana (strain ATCC 22294 / BCRC 22015 / CBS 2517 / CECT 1963 / NBRC 1671 / NRRL Y-8276) TaxID=1071382 RepID=H2B034_KAZAF|nr:hypothetical protein KAFR_0I02040 [Kazachstania africana CBS 2517]CCF59984.1 hypothetical protein KAFR_0I02040 [Kazachstania africana CBS 2517]